MHELLKDVRAEHVRPNVTAGGCKGCQEKTAAMETAAIIMEYCAQSITVCFACR